MTIALAIAAAGAVTLVTRDLNSRMGRAGQQALVLSTSLAEHTTQTFAMLDALSLAVMEDLNNPIVAKVMLPEVLERRSAAETAAKGIAVVGADGIVVFSSTNRLAAGSDLSQRETYTSIRDSHSQSTHVSRPYRSQGITRADTQDAWSMDFSRRIEDANGDFAGVILIVLDEPAIYGFYAKLDVEDGTVIGMAGEDDIIRASNFLNAIGRDIPSSVSRLVAAGEHIKVGNASDTGLEYIFGHSRSTVVPLFTYVGIPTAPLYSAWRLYAALVTTALAALSAALLAVGTILSKYVTSRSELLASELEAASERQERKFLEAILETGGALVAVADPQGQLVVANPAFRAILCEGPKEGNPRTLKLEQALGRPLQDIMASLPFQTAANITDGTGRRRELSWTVSGLRSDSGEIRNLVAIGFDNTEQREAELAIYQSGKLITLGEMATGLAHEINQPLGAIGLAVDHFQTRLSARRANPEFMRDTLALIGRHVERANRIVSHMRVFGHRSDGTPERLDPAVLIEGVLTLAEAQLEHENIALERNFNENTISVLAVGVFTEQILLNLLFNARDSILAKRIFDPAGWPALIKFDVSASNKGKAVEISIEDNGVGLEPEIRERLFEPFFTTKAPGQGTGLGLSLSYGMARQMGGSIKAEDTGNGARFTLTLPCGAFSKVPVDTSG
ncbi:ATP-binding protein [Mesorhizobium sp. NBSH29]|uniref:ATP-binding protein n=1 Tax=Mesorhizobium sp. NBSH29 TaxID=2654249 RepID=UPI0018966931|nr:ATP-binding protein [Mesorhizobium sp. NBSH29]